MATNKTELRKEVKEFHNDYRNKIESEIKERVDRMFEGDLKKVKESDEYIKCYSALDAYIKFINKECKVSDIHYRIEDVKNDISKNCVLSKKSYWKVEDYDKINDKYIKSLVKKIEQSLKQERLDLLVIEQCKKGSEEYDEVLNRITEGLREGL